MAASAADGISAGSDDVYAVAPGIYDVRKQCFFGAIGSRCAHTAVMDSLCGDDRYAERSVRVSRLMRAQSAALDCLEGVLF